MLKRLCADYKDLGNSLENEYFEKISQEPIYKNFFQELVCSLSLNRLLFQKQK